MRYVYTCLFVSVIVLNIAAADSNGFSLSEEHFEKMRTYVKKAPWIEGGAVELESRDKQPLNSLLDSVQALKPDQAWDGKRDKAEIAFKTLSDNVIYAKASWLSWAKGVNPGERLSHLDISLKYLLDRSQEQQKEIVNGIMDKKAEVKPELYTKNTDVDFIIAELKKLRALVFKERGIDTKKPASAD